MKLIIIRKLSKYEFEAGSLVVTKNLVTQKTSLKMKLVFHRFLKKQINILLYTAKGLLYPLIIGFSANNISIQLKNSIVFVIVQNFQVFSNHFIYII